MRALVAGGAGFIGSHLVDRLLDEGHEVDVVDDLSTGSLANLSEARAERTGRLKIHQVDIRDPAVGDLVEQRHPDVVYSLCAPDATGGVVDDAERIVIGGLRLLDGARRAGAQKFVVATGAELYGATPSHPVRESDADAVHDVIAASPLALLTYLRAHRETHDVEFAMLVLSTVYGPRQRHGIVADLVDRCWSDEECAADRDGAQTCDLVFVHDAVDAFVRAADRGSGLVVNVGTGHETTVADLHATVARHVVAAGGPRSGPLAPSATTPLGPRRSALDPSRARIQLGWSPWTEVDDGIGQTVEAARP